MICAHPTDSRRFYRVTFANGAMHVVERCIDCGKNVRGTSHYVGREETGIDPRGLPPDPFARPAALPFRGTK